MRPEARLELPCLPLYVGAATAFAAALAERAGFRGDDVAAVRGAVDEACAYVLQRCEGSQLDECYEVCLDVTSRGLTVRVRDRALPVDPGRLEQELHSREADLGLRLMGALMDEVRFFNLGRDGNEVVMVKRFKGKLRRLFHPLILDQESPEEPLEEPVLRLVQPEEAVEVSRCMYRAYGYGYSGEESVYQPHWVERMCREGSLISAVAVLSSGEIVGHTALSRTEDQGIFEMGQGAVVPGYRGRRLLSRLIRELVDEADRRGIQCIFAEPVTSHPFSQKAIQEFGFVECGLMMACIPAEQTSPDPTRVSVLPSLRLTGARAQRGLYAPADYEPLLRRLVVRLGIGRDFLAANGQAVEGEVAWSVHSPMGKGVVRVGGFGPRTQARLLRVLKQLLERGLAVLYVDVNLNNPGAPACCRYLNDLGFFFSAFFPGSKRDCLRLQYLDHLQLDAGSISAVSPWAVELRDFVIEDRRRRTQEKL